MKIALATALLLGVASARNILTSISGTYNMFQFSSFSIDSTYEADFGYSTAFTIEEDSTDAYLWTAGYSLGVDAYGSYSATFTFGSLLTYTVDVSATLFDITPYVQYITVTRPDAILYDSAATYKVAVSAERDVSFGYVEVTHTPDVLVTSVSLLDNVMNMISGTTVSLSDWIPISSASWDFQGDDDVAITDSYLAYNFAEDFLGLSTSEWYYGTQEYFSYELSL